MRFLFLPLLFLPFLEIAGFVVIGGQIGLAATFLWLVASTLLGFYVLQAYGAGAWTRARSGSGGDAFTAYDLFDGLCWLIAGILLVFPGFISDFLSIPFIIAPCRHWLFRRMKDNPGVFVRTHTRSNPDKTTTIIDGEFRRTDTEAGNSENKYVKKD
jgi:UPF0716 protein FxsA